MMTNRVGGVPEYVVEDFNVVMSADARENDWVDRLWEMERNRDCLEARCSSTRQWAEKFDWENIAKEYQAMYRELVGY